ncbi:hypothetical protein ACFQZJ_08720 [Maribacter chungangensis]|uniref:DUF4221 domain-containing protein n=1 Tax=Maribacter chungangensis TaxID=1069117 RepID=A0ABW3B344_9FLAO
MKVWRPIARVVLGGFLLGCSASDDGSQDNEMALRATEYNVLFSSASGPYTKKIAANPEGLHLNDTESISFSTMAPSITHREGSKIIMYQNTGDCDGNIVFYDFEDTTEFSTPVFSDLSSCTLGVTAVTQQDNTVFLSYVIDVTAKEQVFFIRSFDLNTNTHKDYVLNKKPVKLAVSGAKLFVLTWDEHRTEKNALTILDIKENIEILEMDMGFNVGTMFKKTNGDIIVAYPDAHTTIDGNSLASTYTKYTTGTEPHFFNSEQRTFDATGNMYYLRSVALNNQPKASPAMHDFDKNSTVLYYFENFLNEAQLRVEYNVKQATTVSYDDVNNLIVIGYQKNNSAGGVIRITPAPDLKLVDNFDLQDIPLLIFPTK